MVEVKSSLSSSRNFFTTSSVLRLTGRETGSDFGGAGAGASGPILAEDCGMTDDWNGIVC